MVTSQNEQPADLTLNKYSLEYPFEEVQQLTRNFDASVRLGSGSFGAVYKGTMPDGTDVAVKCLETATDAGFEEEVRVLSKFRHPNLVILMGFARQGSRRFCVYEYLAGGDLQDRLRRAREGTASGGASFVWRQRVSAALDAACGLSHLHHATPKVFHRDIKSANILLDWNGTAKMADFGFACLSHAPSCRVRSAAGTVGYACPHYARRKVVTEGSEVYSFGIVLLELLTASPPAWVISAPDGAETYVFLVTGIAGEVARALALADPKALWPQQVAAPLSDLALRCIQADEDQRPPFVELVKALRQFRNAPDAPPMCMDKSTSARSGGMMLPGLPPPPAGTIPGPLLPPLLTSPPPVTPLTPVQASPAAPPAAALQPQPRTKAADLGPLLWTVECTYAEGVDLTGSACDQKNLAHQAVSSGGPVSLMPFSVGRAIQEDFFVRLVPGDEDRSMLSREHFQISAELTTSGPAASNGPTTIPCKFLLTNVGSSWTMVDNQLLDACGKSARLRDGSRIFMGRRMMVGDGGVRYAPFLQFRFDLTGSILRDVENVALQAVAADGAGQLTRIPRPPAQDLPWPVPCAATSLVDDVTPLFLLELGGCGVREGLPMESRVIVHGPAAGGRGRGAPGDCGPGRTCNNDTTRKSGGYRKLVDTTFTPLVLGGGCFSWFWQKALSPMALQALPQEHVVFESAASAMGTVVSIRNLSAEKQVSVCCNGGVSTTTGAVEGSGSRFVGCGESVPVLNGDIIVLLAEPSHSLWLSFRELPGVGSAEADSFPLTWVAGG